MDKEDTKTETKKKRIGEILLSEQLVTREQLKEALGEQKKSKVYVPLGEVCTRLKFMSKVDLRRVLRKHKKHLYLGELLVNMGIISGEVLVQALEVQKTEQKRLGEILVGKGFLSPTQLVDNLSLQLGIPKIVPDLKLIDKRLLKGINREFLVKHESLPAFKDEGVLTVIMADPLHEETIALLEKFFKARIEPAVATAGDIKDTINLYFRELEYGPGPPAEIAKDLVIGETDLSTSGGDTIVEILNYIISGAVTADASDIHIEPQEKSVRVRFRIDGMLHHKTDLPTTLARNLISRIKVLCGLNIAERRIHQDGRIEARVAGKEVDLRVSTYASMWGENVVIRVLLRRTRFVDLDMLGFSPANLERYKRVLDYPCGIVLATGPTGSGTTTTLYASLLHLNRMDRVIITVEDPVEYTIDGVVQGSLDKKVGLTYMDFLKSMMRQDPDVLMIGAIRDPKAAEAAVQAALTGHKVFSTFHTDDTTGALLRLMEMGIDTFLISSTVVSVVAQRLIRVLCPRCKEPRIPAPELCKSHGLAEADLKKYRFFGPNECTECNHTGYKGRTAIHELLILNDGLRDALLARRSSAHVRALARKDAALISMREDGIYKAAQGITSIEEVMRVVFHNEADGLEPRSLDEIVAMCEAGGEVDHDMGLPAPAERVPIDQAREEVFTDQEKTALLEGELYRVRFETAIIDSETERIEEFFREYQKLREREGKPMGPELLDDFNEFVADAAKRLKSTYGADYVEFVLKVKNQRVVQFVETLLLETPPPALPARPRPPRIGAGGAEGAGGGGRPSLIRFLKEGEPGREPVATRREAPGARGKDPVSYKRYKEELDFEAYLES